MELLWGAAERPARGPKPGLTPSRIVQTGIALADAAGLDAVTMNGVADQLRVTTMALYRYLPGKEALIDAMVQAAMGSPPPVDAADWRASLDRWARADRAVFDQHTWLLDLSTCAPVGPNWLAWLEAGLLALSRTGLTPGEQLAVVGMVDGHVQNVARTSREVAGKQRRGAGSAEEWCTTFAHVLSEITDDPRYPTLAQLAASGALQDCGDEFEFGLQRILDGVAAFVGQRVTTP